MTTVPTKDATLRSEGPSDEPPADTEAGEAEVQKEAPKPTQAPKARASSSPEPARDRIKVSFISLPAAGAEVIGAALVVNHAATAAPDMLAAIHLTAFLMSVLFIGIYHIAHQVGSRLIRFLALAGKIALNTVMVLVLWDLHAPHQVFVGEAFTTTEASPALLAGCIIVGTSLTLIVLHWLVVSRFKRGLSIAEFPGAR